MIMPTNLMALSTSTLRIIGKNLSMGSSKEWSKQRLKNNKKMRKNKKETNKILSYGKLQSQESLHGSLNGEKGDLDGISNVQQWLHKSLDPI